MSMTYINKMSFKTTMDNKITHRMNLKHPCEAITQITPTCSHPDVELKFGAAAGLAQM